MIKNDFTFKQDSLGYLTLTEKKKKRWNAFNVEKDGIPLIAKESFQTFEVWSFSRLDIYRKSMIHQRKLPLFVNLWDNFPSTKVN